MTRQQALWVHEQTFWNRGIQPRIDDRSLTEENGVAILSYRVIGKHRVVRCRSTYAQACGAWMLLEHRQTDA